MRVSGSEFRTGGALTSTSTCTCPMARYSTSDCIRIYAWCAALERENTMCFYQLLLCAIKFQHISTCSAMLMWLGRLNLLAVFILVLLLACLSAIIYCQRPQPGLQPDVFSSISTSKSVSSKHKRALGPGGNISACRRVHVSLKHNNFRRYKLVSKRYGKFNEGKKTWNNRGYFISFPWRLGFAVHCVTFVVCVFL